jgi:poly-gamma-glutamate capsule biosynthesis protein CapA/YwtB (metallophosphatase superfamily)
VGRVVTLFLCGDVMCGRGVDQILPHPADPSLREQYVHDAGTYVRLAESVNGPVPAPVDFAWPWGVALQLLGDLEPDVRVINLETSITRSDVFVPGKAVHYRMSPDNIRFLTALRPSVCALANNHMLDFGRRGLMDTLDVLSAQRLPAAGAGAQALTAQLPRVSPVAGGGRVLVYSAGLASSGIPSAWAATPDRPGVNFVDALSQRAADQLIQRVNQTKLPDDVVVVSLHWGPNWGYAVSRGERRFAHRLLDGGVDIVHGHSSHHPRPIEIYHDKLVLYGCGDFVNDYEGISGHAEFRSDLRPMYFVSVEQKTGTLVQLRVAVLQARRLSLRHASRPDSVWLRSTLDRVSRRLATRVDLDLDGLLSVRRA